MHPTTHVSRTRRRKTSLSSCPEPIRRRDFQSLSLHQAKPQRKGDLPRNPFRFINPSLRGKGIFLAIPFVSSTQAQRLTTDHCTLITQHFIQKNQNPDFSASHLNTFPLETVQNYSHSCSITCLHFFPSSITTVASPMLKELRSGLLRAEVSALANTGHHQRRQPLRHRNHEQSPIPPRTPPKTHHRKRRNQQDRGRLAKIGYLNHSYRLCQK
jgi:hypothetical protein